MTFKEYELLKLLMQRPGIVFSRQEIMERVWGIDFTLETRTVDMHVKTLRQKLGENNDIIKTVRNVGYKAEL
ncbi:Transcriptional regulatory protein, C terminal [Fibrobacter sp. UWH9]|nr:winged helix-turn-helix domain-containing protein [Fibrobacter sp. UWH9]SHH49458.1 Transcriptional regulatory protein, C terminal [Fibrobacter sp. UWH9]